MLGTSWMTYNKYSLDKWASAGLGPFLVAWANIFQEFHIVMLNAFFFHRETLLHVGGRFITLNS